MERTELRYPDYFYDADAKSGKGQRIYKWLFKIELGILIAASICTFFIASDIVDQKALALVILILFIIEIVIRLTIKFSDVHREWYYGRAIAESVKTSTWRYIMRAEPFDKDEDQDLMFEEMILAFYDSSEVPSSLKKKGPDFVCVTDQTTAIRSTSLEERKERYLTDRIDDQRKWYSSKAEFNRKWHMAVSVTVISMYILALILSGYFIYNPVSIKLFSFFPIDLNIVSLLAVIATSFLAWSQLNRFKDLYYSYTAAENEIHKVKLKITPIQDEAIFSEFVADAENAFSREHTMWMARKDSVS